MSVSLKSPKSLGSESSSFFGSNAPDSAPSRLPTVPSCRVSPAICCAGSTKPPERSVLPKLTFGSVGGSGIVGFVSCAASTTCRNRPAALAPSAKPLALNVGW